MKDRLIPDLFSPELAAATGVNVVRLKLGSSLAFSKTAIVGPPIIPVAVILFVLSLFRNTLDG